MKMMETQRVLRVVSLMGMVGCIILAAWGFKSGAFASRQVMEETVAGFGIWGVVLFILIQAVQVVVPILPGGVSCLAGVLLFGAVRGFWYNYIGICIGSILAFSFARCYGRPLLLKLFGPKLLQKYDGWTEASSRGMLFPPTRCAGRMPHQRLNSICARVHMKRFDRLFVLAIFLPVAPDDFLCYLAGTTAMSWKLFIFTILLGKPFAILLYSLFLHTAWSRLLLGAG